MVDNASGTKPARRLRILLQKCGAEILQNEKNLGYNAGNNKGIARALSLGCAYILVVNNDVCFHPDSIRHMKSYLQNHPDTGIVGPKILDFKGCLQKSCLCRRTGLKEKYLVRTCLHVLFRKSYRTYFGYDRDYEKSFRVYAVLGCCFMMSAVCARAVTPFDEYPFLYEEELMLGIRMETAGFRTVYCPKAVISHLHGGSTRQRKAFSFAQNVKSEIYYCREYLHAQQRQILPLYLYRVLLYLMRCVRYADFRRRWKWFLKMTWREMRR